MDNNSLFEPFSSDKFLSILAEANGTYFLDNNNISSSNNNNIFLRQHPALKHVEVQALLDRFSKNRNFDGPWYYILITVYSILILFGSLGNALVVLTVLRRPTMRTARNLFILNLAISDLLLCLVTMPLTLVEILSKYWPFGACAILCKLVAMLQATSIFVSTISITAIAFDRYQVIVYPTHASLQFLGALTMLIGIWLLALLLASPLFIFKRLVHVNIPNVLQMFGIRDVLFCIEDWPVKFGRFYYSIFSLCVQYLLPILIVSSAYFGIYNKLKNRFSTITTTTTTTASMDQRSDQRKSERGRRVQRINCLLISIAIMFGISWLPLNFYNIYADLQQLPVTQHMLMAYAACHMIGMSSACSNPVLYGWLNENFRKEFQEVICCFLKRSKSDSATASVGGVRGDGDGEGVCGSAANGGTLSYQSRRKRKDAEILRGDLKLLIGSSKDTKSSSGEGPRRGGSGGGEGVMTCDIKTRTISNSCEKTVNVVVNGCSSEIPEPIMLNENTGTILLMR